MDEFPQNLEASKQKKVAKQREIACLWKSWNEIGQVTLAYRWTNEENETRERSKIAMEVAKAT